MPLTQTQLTTLKNDMAVNTTVVSATNPDTGQVVTDQIKNLDKSQGFICNAVADWYNLFPAVDFFGNYATVPVAVIRNCITWSKLTPADAPSSTNAATFLACQGSQWSLELMGLLGTSGNVIDCTKKNIVQGLNDALKAVPSLAGGATQDAGWSGATGVKQNICRKGTNAEKLLADTTGGTGADTGHAATYTFEGSLTGTDVLNAFTNG